MAFILIMLVPFRRVWRSHKLCFGVTKRAKYLLTARQNETDGRLIWRVPQSYDYVSLCCYHKKLGRRSWLVNFGCVNVEWPTLHHFAALGGRAGMAQCWERSPRTNASRVRFPEPAGVGWVCCWFSILLREVFLRVLRFSPLLKTWSCDARTFMNEFLWTPLFSVGKQITSLYFILRIQYTYYARPNSRERGTSIYKLEPSALIGNWMVLAIIFF